MRRQIGMGWPPWRTARGRGRSPGRWRRAGCPRWRTTPRPTAPGSRRPSAGCSAGSGPVRRWWTSAAGPAERRSLRPPSPPRRVLAVDRDLRLIDVAGGQAAARVADRVRWASGAVGASPSGGADLAWASGVVHHVPDQQAAVASWRRSCGRAARWPWWRAACRCGASPRGGRGRARPRGQARRGPGRWFADLGAELSGRRCPTAGRRPGHRRAGRPADDVLRGRVERPLDAAGLQMAHQHLAHASTSWATGSAPATGPRCGASSTRATPCPSTGGDDLTVTAVRTVHAGTRPCRATEGGRARHSPQAVEPGVGGHPVPRLDSGSTCPGRPSPSAAPPAGTGSSSTSSGRGPPGRPGCRPPTGSARHRRRGRLRPGDLGRLVVQVHVTAHHLGPPGDLGRCCTVRLRCTSATAHDRTGRAISAAWLYRCTSPPTTSDRRRSRPPGCTGARHCPSPRTARRSRPPGCRGARHCPSPSDRPAISAAWL